MTSITLFAAVIMTTTASVSADSSVVDTVTIDLPSSCSMNAVVDTAHTATLEMGTYSGGSDYPNGIGKTSVSVFCNDPSGFAVYAVGFTGDTYGNNTMVGTNANNTIPTGTATSGTISQWAMKLAKVTDTSIAYNPANMTITNNYDNYHAVPNSYDKVASFSSATDFTLGAKFTTTYAAYISNSQAADTYTGKVKYTLVHPADAAAPGEPVEPINCPGGYICYSPGPSSVTDSMGNRFVSSTATSIMLWPSNFKRQGYGFAGWTDKPDWVLGANDASGNGTGANAGYHIYGPMQDIEFTAGQYSTSGLALYAVWVPSAGSIQNWTCPNNTTMPIGTVTALTDQRDNDTYAVAKLADGKCWMIENLRLDNTNSDNATGALAQGYGGQFVGLANPETANFTATNGMKAATAANSIYYAGTLVSPATVDIVQNNYAGYRMPRFNNNNTNTDVTVNPNTTIANMTNAALQNIYSYGNYYTWAAAKANTGYYYDIANSNAAATSICPKGWHLPTGAGSGEFGVLSNSLGGYKDANDEAQYMDYSTTPTGVEMSKVFRTFPNNFVYSGNVNGNSPSNRGGSGYYWSATASGIFDAYHFYLYIEYVGPGAHNYKYYGGSVRCALSPSS